MIAKGKVFIPVDELKKLFNLPEEVEIISADLNGYHDTNVVNFNIVSKEPIGLLTSDRPNWVNLRRHKVPREKVSYQPVSVGNFSGLDKEAREQRREELKAHLVGYSNETLAKLLLDSLEREEDYKTMMNIQTEMMKAQTFNRGV